MTDNELLMMYMKLEYSSFLNDLHPDLFKGFEECIKESRDFQVFKLKHRINELKKEYKKEIKNIVNKIKKVFKWKS